VEGNPYSRTAESDIVIRCRGGDSGRGRENMSLTNPVKNTPQERICTILHPSAYILFLARFSSYALAMEVCPHQKRIGSTIMKNVCVPRLAVIAK